MELFNNKIVCNEKVGIGTNDPQGMLQINGDIYYGNTHKTLPLYVKGTGKNNALNSKIILGGDTIIDQFFRGLILIIIDGTNLTVKNFDIVGYISKNILDYSNDWLEVSSGSSITGSNRPINWLPYQNVDSENKIFHNEVGPFGNSESIWKTESLDSDNAGWDGGWNTDTFNVDTSYGYLYTVYFKPTVYSKSANSSNEQSVLNFFFGCRQVRHLDSDNVSDNPYFISSVQMKNAGLLENRWYLAVGTILPSSTPTNATQTMPNSLTGIYDTVTRTKINISSSLLFDWRHVNNINTHRAGVIYGGNNIGEKVEFARPGVYKIDGTEPSLQDLLGSRYDIYGYTYKPSSDLAYKIKNMTNTDIGILVGCDSINRRMSNNLKEVALRVGLTKLYQGIGYRQPYAAVFCGTSTDNDNLDIYSRGYTKDVIERLESSERRNSGLNAPPAVINTILSTDGVNPAITGASSVSAIWGDQKRFYPTVKSQFENRTNSTKIKGNVIIDNYGIIKVACGETHSLILLNNRKVLGLGQKKYLGINNSSTTGSYLPIYINITAIDISCGKSHSLYLTDAGRVFAFGDNTYGQLGDNSTTERLSYVTVNNTAGYNNENAMTISCGHFHSMILLNTGKVVSFGRNDKGQLGDGTGGNTNDSSNIPVAVSTDSSNGNDYNGENAIAIACGTEHSMILLNTGKVLSFGKNFSGQLGNGTSGSVNNTNKPIAVSTTTDYTGSNAIAIASGGSHSMILLNSGKVLSFGWNSSGQLGDGSTIDKITPVTVSTTGTGNEYDGSNAIAINCNQNNSIILLNTGKVLSFGNNFNGQLGDGTSSNRNTPTPVSTDSSNGNEYDGSNAIAIINGYNYSMILLNTGKIMGFGKNDYNQLGLNNTSNQLTPILSSTYNCGGNLGVNVNNPEVKLEIKHLSDNLTLNNTLPERHILISRVIDNNGWFISNYQDPNSDPTFYLRFINSYYWYNNALVYFYISNNGVLGPTSFTGQHLNLLNKNIDKSYYGLIVSSTGKYINLKNQLKPSINESLPICNITNIYNDKKVFGVISDKEDDNRIYTSGNTISSLLKYNNNEQRMRINSLGEGGIWVSNKNDNLKNGDYITSSSIPGYGIKQIINKGLITNYTVAKITCNCDFNLNKIIKQKLKIINETDSNNNTIKNIDYNENGDFQYEDDLDDNNNQQLIYEYKTRFLLSDGTQITKEEYDNKLSLNEEVYIACFVGCTYHCG
jgi:alpha-tubulin suppressor-like RCC1 family protein